MVNLIIGCREKQEYMDTTFGGHHFGITTTTTYKLPTSQINIDSTKMREHKFVCPHCNKKFSIEVVDLKKVLKAEKVEFQLREVFWGVIFSVLAILSIVVLLFIPDLFFKVLGVIGTIFFSVSAIASFQTVIKPSIKTDVDGFVCKSLSHNHPIHTIIGFNLLQSFSRNGIPIYPHLAEALKRFKL